LQLTCYSIFSLNYESNRILTHVFRVRKVESLNPKGWPNLTQRCKRFAIASTSTQVAVLPWRYDAEMVTANSSHASA